MEQIFLLGSSHTLKQIGDQLGWDKNLGMEHEDSLIKTQVPSDWAEILFEFGIVPGLSLVVRVFLY